MKDSQKRPWMDDKLIRERVGNKSGRDYWRSLDELADSKAFRDLLHREFPEGASEWNDGVGRREFLKVMGASLALAGMTSCTSQPVEKILPYVRAPEDVVPGRPQFFASATTLGGFANGVLVESHMGRPTKIEGNPEHPSSLGSTDVFSLASVLTLYDPDRSQVVHHAGRIATWGGFLDAVTKDLANQEISNGAGLRVLTETVTSPTLARQLEALRERFPQSRWHQFEPVDRDAERAGARLAFGEDVATRYRFDQARVILSLDADFLTCGPGSLAYARAFASGRRAEGAMNRLYAVESSPSNTGGMADHRLTLTAGEIEGFARAVASRLGIEAGPDESADHETWIAALVRDLKRHPGACVVVAGQQQPPEVHALAHAMNHALGNVGETVVYTDPVEESPTDHAQSLRDLVDDMAAGRVELLLILGGNPAFTAHADLAFADRLSDVKTSVHLSLYDDETSKLCHWHVPEAHPLEAWSDAKAFEGSVSIIQPLIEPLYGGRSVHEVASVFTGQAGRSGYDIVRETWKGRDSGGDFERFWRRSLHDGYVAGSSLPPKKVSLKGKIGAQARRSKTVSGLEVIFRPDPTVWDGRFSNNGWLQELPKPVTRLTWDNAALMSVATAERLGLQNEEVVDLGYRGRSVKAPVWIVPGHPADSVTLHLGYGRTAAGRLGSGAGFNANALRTSDAPWFGRGLEVSKTGEHQELACTQEHSSMEGRHLIREGTAEEYQKNPAFVSEMGHDPDPDLTLYDPEEHQSSEGYAWGMAIDLNACTGCNGCTIACQSENNIPVVGRREVMNGREMHWIRVDRYFEGDMETPEMVHQPVPCMHCEDAPCELVCPVAATVHSDEGLNEMVYNRCVGTRYCSNNCPYKVRRFNFFQYADEETPSLKLLQNPDVTIRARGVMEKCTYCVQRINSARITAKMEDREIQDGDILTACQAACPTEAIVFGNINDPNSRVSRMKSEPRNYGLLTELNTKPRTTYLARLRNPNPEIEHG